MSAAGGLFGAAVCGILGSAWGARASHEFLCESHGVRIETIEEKASENENEDLRGICAVKVIRAHKIRLNPTPEQEQWLLKACGVARFVYNWGLEEWRRQYEAGGKPSAYTLKKQFNAIRREQFPWTYEVTKNAVDTGFKNLEAAFRNFFRRVKEGSGKVGYPRFKSRKRSKMSFRMDGCRVKAGGHWVKLEKLDEPINMTEPLRFDGVVSYSLLKQGGLSRALRLKSHPRP